MNLDKDDATLRLAKFIQFLRLYMYTFIEYYPPIISRPADYFIKKSRWPNRGYASTFNTEGGQLSWIFTSSF